MPWACTSARRTPGTSASAEDHYRHVLPFTELLKLWERAGEEAKRQGKPEMTYLESNIDFLRSTRRK